MHEEPTNEATEDINPPADDAPQSPVADIREQWGALAPEQQQLIRLAALPADRETGLRPLMFATLGRVSRHSAEFSMLKLSIEISGMKHAKGVNELEVWVDHARKEVSFLPEDGLRTEPANRGLGRFMIALAARWLQHKCAHYKVQSIPLQTKYISNDNARLRRDYSLQAQGFTVSYEDGLQMKANCSAARASQIHKDWNIDKVRIVNVSDSAEILQSADKTIREQERELKKITEQLAVFQREDNALKFTISMLVIFAVFQAVLLIWMATR